MSNNKNKETRDNLNPNADKNVQSSDTYKKLPDNPADSGDDYSVSTADDSSGGKYSKTGQRKEDKDPSNRQSN